MSALRLAEGWRVSEEDFRIRKMGLSKPEWPRLLTHSNAAVATQVTHDCKGFFASDALEGWKKGKRSVKLDRNRPIAYVALSCG